MAAAGPKAGWAGWFIRLSPGGASYGEKNAPWTALLAITTTARIPYVWGEAQLAVPSPRPQRAWQGAPMAASSAVVTGAARGFGKEIARRLVARGHRVLITDLDADAVAATAAELGAGCVGVVADARSAADHRRVADAAAELGPVAVWVNNAGVLRAGKAWELAEDDVARQVEVNLLGVVHGSRTAVAAMRAAGGTCSTSRPCRRTGRCPGSPCTPRPRPRCSRSPRASRATSPWRGCRSGRTPCAPTRPTPRSCVPNGARRHRPPVLPAHPAHRGRSGRRGDGDARRPSGRAVAPARPGRSRPGRRPAPRVGLPVLARLRARGDRAVGRPRDRPRSPFGAEQPRDAPHRGPEVGS